MPWNRAEVRRKGQSKIVDDSNYSSQLLQALALNVGMSSNSLSPYTTTLQLLSRRLPQQQTDYQNVKISVHATTPGRLFTVASGLCYIERISLPPCLVRSAPLS